MKNKYLILFCILINVVSYSQENRLADDLLEEVVIEENRLQIPFHKSTRNIQVLTKADIEKLPVTSINEILAYISGVDIRQRGPFGSQADISIDGGSFEQTMVLWNGVKMGDAQTAHHSMNLPIPIQAIERIEILKGPAARIYGINALTGAINIVTKTQMQNFAQVNASVGSSFKNNEEANGIYTNSNIQATAGYHHNKINHLISIAKEDTNGQRYNTSAKNLKAMYQGNANINYKNNIQWLSGYIDNEFGANGYYAAPHDKESYELVQTLLVAVSSSHQLTDKFTIKPRISNRYNEDDYRFYRNDLSKARSFHYSNALMVELNGVYKTNLGDFGLGYELRLEDINSSNLGSHSRNNHGWFTEYKQTYFDKLLVNAGAYFNYNSDYGFQWYPGVDAAYFITDDFKVQASVGSSQRIPSFTDLYVNQRPGNIGNSELKPENAWQYEVGFTYTKLNKQLNVSAFNRTINDFIDWTRLTTDEPYQPQNLADQQMQGFNIRYKHDIEIGTQQYFNYTISYQYLSPQQKETNNQIISKYTIESLKHQAIIGLNYTYSDFGVQWQNRYIKRELNEGYFISDVKLSYQFTKFQLYSTVTNIFNTTYKEVAAVPMPSRWFNIGVNVKF